MNNIYNYNFEQLGSELQNHGCQKFRSKQVWEWLYQKNVTDFSSMKNIDKKTLNVLSEFFILKELEVVKHNKDVDGTQKALLRLSDGELIETVFMKQSHGNSVCVTTQVGCRIGCSFCASQIAGFTRNLTSGEIVQQIMFWQNLLKEQEQRVSHVVVMGIGEPFDNYDNVIEFINIINDENGLKIGARHITVSTSGIIPGIEKLADYPKQVNLAISLHAPNNEIRSSIMKINKKYTIEEIIHATKLYIRKTNRRVSFEYIMISGVNDSLENAEELVNLLRGLNCHVNLIPFNTVDELELKQSSAITIDEFYDVLNDNHIQVSIRRPKGANIDGACGQLRHKNV